MYDTAVMFNPQDPVHARLMALETRIAELAALTSRAILQQRNLWLARVAEADGRLTDPLSLLRHHAQMFSQNGEDGIIAEIFRRIGTRDRVFVEIGIETGMQCNTRLLLEAGWRGVWVEGDPAKAEAAAVSFRHFRESGALTIVAGILSPANVEAVFDRAGVPPVFDFLSLDIDRHTQHIWRAMQRRCRVACIEYNASIPPSLSLEVPYDPARSWDGSNRYGAGLKTLELIGAAREMALVGCDASGTNAFFVAAAEAAGRFRAPFTAETHWEAPKYKLPEHAGHPPCQMPAPLLIAPEANGQG